MDVDELQRMKLEAEVQKLRAEAQHLVGTPWSRLAETIKVTGAILATVVAGWAALKTWEVTQLQTRITQSELAVEQAKLTRVRNELVGVQRQLGVAQSRVRATETLAGKALANPEPTVPIVAATGPERWVYVGSYRPDAKKWETKYLDFADDPDPQSLAGRDLPVNRQTGALNVRPGIPNDKGILPPPVDTLPENARVHINRMQRWGASLWFANVRY